MRAPAARRVVERWQRDGRVSLHSSVPSILAYSVSSLLVIGVAVTLARMPGDKGGLGVGLIVFGAFVLVAGTIAVRLVVPWTRVIVDRDGFLVLGRRLLWSDIRWFDTDTDAYVSRTSLPFVTAQVGEGVAAAWAESGRSRWSRLARQPVVSHPGEVALPYRLGVRAEPLAAALQTILAEQRSGLRRPGAY
ncbi:MAG: hypothetical protein JWP82_1811 [Humibacillus sp.]|nr:hypothetical protein [Humibacillus sp.]